MNDTKEVTMVDPIEVEIPSNIQAPAQSELKEGEELSFSEKARRLTREEVIALSNSYKTKDDRQLLKEYFSRIHDRVSTQKHTIVFSCPAETGTSFFRIFEPMLAMYREGDDDFNLVYTENISSHHYNIADIIVLHRAGDGHDITHTVMNAWPRNKISPYLIHNVDDNEVQLSKSHPMYWMWLKAGRDKQAMRSMRLVDLVEITTRKLKQVAGTFNNNVLIVPNCFNWKLPLWNLEKKRPLEEFAPDLTEEQKKHYAFPEAWKDKVVVGWAGLTSHYEDLKKIATILQKVHDERPDTVFAVCGMALKDSSFEIRVNRDGSEEYVENHEIPEDQKYKSRVKKLFEKFDPERVVIYDALNLEQYAWFYSLMDVGIALVKHDTFNMAKSSIKFVECLKYGAPTVCSDFGGYNDTFHIMRASKDLDQELIETMACRTEADHIEWVKKLLRLVDDHKKPEFKAEVQKITDFLTQLYDIDAQAKETLARYKTYIRLNIEQQQEWLMKEQMGYAEAA